MSETAKSLIKFVKEFIDEGRARANSRWFSVFILSWLMFNWKRVIDILFHDYRSSEYMIETIGSMLRVGVQFNNEGVGIVEALQPIMEIIAGYGVIFLTWVFWIYGKPCVDLLTTRFLHTLKKRIRATEFATSMQKENMEIAQFHMNKTKVETELSKKNEELEEKILILQNIIACNNLKECIVNKGEIDELYHHIKQMLAFKIHEVSKYRHDIRSQSNDEVWVSKLDKAIQVLDDINSLYDNN